VPPDIIRIMEERKKGEWLGHVGWMWHGTRVQDYQKSLIVMNNLLHF